MKRFHVHVAVENLNASLAFYSKTFGTQTVVRKIDYERIARGDAPDAVKFSEEFRSLCPDSAVCMIKRFTDE